MVVCVGCSKVTEMRMWEVWLSLFKCSLGGARAQIVTEGVLTKVGAFVCLEYLGTAPKANGRTWDRTFEGRWPSTTPFRRFKRFDATGTVYSYGGSWAKGSFGLVTSQMRISSKSGDVKRREVDASVWFVCLLVSPPGGKSVREREKVRNGNGEEVWCNWFDC
ncbi:MAG: hypothetical protein ACTS4V_01590 [Candidatus Hodgkinia cicadicola]